MTGEGNTNSLPLEDLHKAAGAKFGAFAGWMMPLTYPAGVMKEHQHTREHVGLFDISHMKLILVYGPQAAALLSRACPLDAGALEPSQSKYTFFLNGRAGIEDDLIVKGFEATVEPLERIFLAVQGPEAEAALNDAGIETGALSFMHGVEPRENWFMSRSGYTGEDGFEIGLPQKDARALLEKLLADGRVMWIGLAARDSLRLEAGLCLHGQDLTPDTDPVAAGLLWAVPKDLRASGDFIGAEALREALSRGAAEKRVGLKPEGRQPVRAGSALFDADGNQAGRVTSGGFGPSAGHPVAMGYVAAALAKPGTRLFADVRGTKVPVDVAALPFLPHRYHKG
mgnify:CR=1 FL=1